MHHFIETETQWTYRGPWAFYSMCPKYERYGITLRGHFQGQKGPKDLRDLFQLISQKRYIV